jgi:branched-chain amino acid transport system permease protein
MTTPTSGPRQQMRDRMRGYDDRRAGWARSIRSRWYGLPRPARWLGLLALVVVLYLLPIIQPPILTTPDSDFGSVLFDAALFALVAIGLNVVIGMAGLLDLGYVGFYAVGAYSVAMFGSPNSSLGTGYPWLVCVPIAIALSMLAGVILGGPTLRLRGDYLAIVTLGFGEIVRLTAVNSNALGAAAGITGVPFPPGKKPDGTDIFSILNINAFYWLALTVIFIVVLGVRNLENSRVGRSWLAIREDEDAAELMGVPTFRFKLWAFAIGAAVGGLSGSLFAGRQGFINPDSFALQLSILFVAAVVLGGAGNLLGVVTGAVVIAYLPERFRGFADYRIFVFGLALIIVMIFRPQGIIPNRRRATELAVRTEEVAEGA